MKDIATFTPLYPRHLWTLKAILELQATQRGTAPFLRWTHEEAAVSFAEVNAETNRLAHGFLQLGLKKGDRIVSYLSNSLSHVYCWFAFAKIGAVDALINENFFGAFLIHQANLSRARFAIVDESRVERIADVQASLEYLQTLIVVGKADAARRLLPHLKVFELAEIATDKVSNPSIEIVPSDPASIQFTSGTTGPSKGVLMPNGALHFNAEEVIAVHGITEEDSYLSPFPLFHGSARQTALYPMLVAGGLCVLYPKFSGTRFLERARLSQATITMFHGSMVQMIAQQDPSPADRDHKLRSAICLPMPYTLTDEFERRFGISLREVVGMTETSLTVIPMRGVKAPQGYAGLAVGEWYDVRVADPETDEEVRDGTVGELQVRPRFPWITMLCYENMPSETAAAQRNLWFHTGDGVRRNADGWIGFVDRIKDSVRRRGENVSSFEVEYQLLAHPAVVECAVVGVRLEKDVKDEEVKACIIRKRGRSVPEAELVAWCEARLPHFAVPRFIEFVDELPKTPTGKIQKNKLREHALNEKTWDRLATRPRE